MLCKLLTIHDWTAFRDIRLEALILEPAAYASTVYDWQQLPQAEWERRMTMTPVIGAFDDQALVGIMGLIRQNPSKIIHRATLIMVYVQEQHRGTAVASDLLAATIAHAKAIGIRQMELNVSVENPAAIRFYEREGFVPFGRLPAAIMHDSREIDEIMMGRRIDET